MISFLEMLLLIMPRAGEASVTKGHFLFVSLKK